LEDEATGSVCFASREVLPLDLLGAAVADGLRAEVERVEVEVGEDEDANAEVDEIGLG